MRKVLRYEDNAAYWDRRWVEADHDENAFADRSIYPIRFAEVVMNDVTARAVELGAGLGRVLKHYHYAGHRIVGVERSAVAVERLRAEDPGLHVMLGDVRAIPFADGEFDVVLAFGLYHNIEEGFDRALAETARVLRVGGRFCISMRPDNIEMDLNERYWMRRRPHPGETRRFHKWLVRESEFRKTLERHGLVTESLYRARNVSLLYRVPWLRARARDEAQRRASGYRLNLMGRALDAAIVRLWPAQFCNVLVYIGSRR